MLGFFKFIIGFIIGIFVLATCGAAAGYYFWTRLSVTPAKPIFAEEQPKKASATKTVTSTKTSNTIANKPSLTPSKPVAKPLPPDAYKARVTWQEGLSLRDAPNFESNRIGGVGFNQEVFVLKQSEDGKWQQVRLPESEQEGWIKVGNTEKVN
jgi:hypothetical protein